MNTLQLTISGTLSGVAFRKANEFTDTKTGELVKYGDAVTLTFNYETKVIKEDIETLESDNIDIFIDLTQQEDLKTQVQKYNKMIGQDLTIDLISNVVIKTIKDKGIKLRSDFSKVKKVKEVKTFA